MTFADPAPGRLTVQVEGLGAVGTRVARELAGSPDVAQVCVRSSRPERLDIVSGALGPKVVHRIDRDPDVVVLAGPAGTHQALAGELVEKGIGVVSTSDSVADVTALLALDGRAQATGCRVVAGAAFSPGLTDVLALHAANLMDPVTEVHVAMVGAGGPACAAQRRHVTGRRAQEWRDGEWVERPGGSGRELCWFPDPIGARDCYRAELSEPLLLRREFPGASRLTARTAVSRRDRLIPWFPRRVKRPPEGEHGAVRVEVRGIQDGEAVVVVYAVMDRPSVATSATAAVTALEIGARPSGTWAGVRTVGEVVDPLSFLVELARRGVKAATFEGAY